MVTSLLALLTAASFGLGSVLARKGLNKHQTAFSVVPTFLTGTIALWVVVLATGFLLPSGSGLWLSLLRGVIDPGIAALLVFTAFRKLGVAITIPILASSPLVGIALSVAFLGEQLTTAIVIGTVLILLGVSLLAVQRKNLQIDRRFIFIAIAGMLLIGIANIVTKVALNASDVPIGSAALSFSAASATQILIVALMWKWKSLPHDKSALFFVGSGLMGASGFIFSFMALSQGFVSVVLPLMSTQPLFTLAFAHFLLRGYEKITTRVVIGAVLVVVGAAVLSF